MLKVFGLQYNTAMEIMSARDLSRYLKINNKMPYRLIRETDMPCAWIGGTVTFAKELIDKWIMEKTEWPDSLLIAGCDDEVVRKAVERYNALNNGLAYYSPGGSAKGLKAVMDNKATMACILVPGDGKMSDALSYVDLSMSADEYVVVPLFFREEGIIVKNGNPKKIKTVKDIAAKGATFVNRGQDSETRVRFDSLLKEARVDQGSIEGYGVEVDSDFQVGLQVLQGIADAGFGIRHVADELGLGFVALYEEKIAMVIPTHRAYGADVRRFLEGV